MLWNRTGSYAFFSAVLLVTVSFLVVSPWVLAQTGAGTITGTARDQNQAVLPGAKVTLSQTQTNANRTTVTNEAGILYFGAVSPGPYTVTVDKPGFERWVGTLVLEVGQNTEVNPVLKVGRMEQVVEVRGAAPLINTVSSELADVKDYSRIRELPLNGRTISQIFYLTPGVEGDAGNEKSSSPRVNGMKVGSMQITLDGVSEVDRFGGGFVRVQPGLDTIQELRIETAGSSARYTNPSNVTLATRSGTNTFHGSAYEYHRNNSGGLVARRREDLPTPDNPKAKPAPLIRNEFGISGGGPIILPKLYNGKNKNFFFVDYEGLRDRERFSPFFPFVPTEAMWNGDLSAVNDVLGDGQPVQLYDPLTTDASGNRQPFVNNQIPQGRISQIGQVLHSLTAKPTNNNNPYLAPNFIKFYPDITNDNNLTIKTDHNLSAADSLSVRWTHSLRHAAVEGGYYANPIDTSSGMGTSRRDYHINNAAVNYNHTFSPNLLNELLLGLERSNADYGTLADFTDWDSKLGLPNPFGVTGWPTLYTYENTTGLYYGQWGWDSDNRHNQALTTYSAENHTTWVKGHHKIDFGGNFRHEGNNVRELQQAQGSHSFGIGWTGLWDSASNAPVADTGSGFAELLLGLPVYLSNQYNRGYFYFRQNDMGLYASDDWKVNDRLTVTLGLRWDKWTPYWEKQNRMAVPDIRNVLSTFQVLTPGNVTMESIPGVPPAVLSSWAARSSCPLPPTQTQSVATCGLTWTTANAAGYPSSLFAPDNHNYGPRLGVAFKLNDKTVLRGGLGTYYWTEPLSLILQSTRNNPPLNLRFENNYSTKNQTFNYPYVVAPAATDFLPTATVNINGQGAVPTGAIGATIWDGPNWRDSYASTWHMTLERIVGSKTAVRVTYVGTHGGDLLQQFSLNSPESGYNYATRLATAPPNNRDTIRPNPNWSLISLNHSGYSNTYSGQLEVERKLANGLEFQWFYAFTRSLNTIDPGGFSDGNVGINSRGGGVAVPENQNLWGEPNLSYDQRRHLTYFNSTNIPPQRMRFNWLYDLPLGRGRHWGSAMSGALQQIFGGWSLSGIGDFRGGFWMSPDRSLYLYGNPRLNPNQRLLLNYGGEQARLWFIGSLDPTVAKDVQGGSLTNLIPVDPAQRIVRPYGPDCNGNYTGRAAVTVFDPSQNKNVCANVSVGDLYNPSPRANILGPGAWNTDMSLLKNFKIGERTNLRLSGDFFNAFNHPNDVNPNATTGLQDLGVQANDPRIIQLSLRLEW